jgi:catechol 2,3-dioxygenase-like lactoylglutathione lyase family enzyme
MIRGLAFLCGVLLAAPLAWADPTVQSVDRIIIPVSQLARAVGFYTDAMSFTPDESNVTSGLVLRLGEEKIELVQRAGRGIPVDSQSNDGWFQHLAVVVSDIDLAYAHVVRDGAVPISAGTQRLPAWNPNAGGIRAVYFRDLDGHPLELIQFPPGKGEARWQNKERLFLGIDHTAIAAAETERSLAFYRDRLGFHVAGTSENWGIEQERLSAVPGAHVRITTLRASSGPGIELLAYLTPSGGRPIPADSSQDDLWAEEIVLNTADIPVHGRRPRDPDGHALRLVSAGEETLR